MIDKLKKPSLKIKKTDDKILTPVPQDQKGLLNNIPWAVWQGVAFVLLVYILSQVFGGLILSTYASIRGWNLVQANRWLTTSVFAQFIYIILAEAFTVISIYFFLKYFKSGFEKIKLFKPRRRDVIYGILTIPFYFFTYAIAVMVISTFIPSLNVSQHQHIGFTHVHGTYQLILTFISLVILPPIAEEIMVRGLLYTSLKKWLPGLGAALITSLMFASAHLPEGGASGPLWIAAIDTFVLSMYLIYLREKTNNLWASITLHACKNGIAFFVLFLSPLIHL